MNDSSKERPYHHPNILDNLNGLLSPQNEWEMEDLYNHLINNRFVVESGHIPTLEQFRQYFEQLKKGFEYLQETYGAEALPKQIGVYQGIRKIRGREVSEWIGFVPDTDELEISLVHIAGQCARYDHPSAIFADSHLPKGVGVAGKDHTVLQAIEEGYHRYQHKVLRMDPEKQPMALFEDGIIPVFQKAIADLGIETMRGTWQQ